MNFLSICNSSTRSHTSEEGNRTGNRSENCKYKRPLEFSVTLTLFHLLLIKTTSQSLESLILMNAFIQFSGN